MKQHPLIKVCILFISGIILQKYVSIDISLLIISIGIIIVCGCLLLLVKGIPVIISSFLISIAIVLISSLSFQISLLNLKPYPFDISKLKDVEISGEVKTIELKRKDEISFTLSSDSIKNKLHSVNCNLTFLCKLRDEKQERLDSVYNIIQPGNLISMRGMISKARGKRNPWEFDYQRYLVERGLSGIFTCSDVSNVKIGDCRTDWFNSLIFNARKAIDYPIISLHSSECAALLRGLLLADRSEISDDVELDFVNTGVVHILAVSGSNVLLVILIFSFLFGRLQIFVKTFLTIAGLLLFLAITGVTASVFRAVLMAIIVLIAQITNRSSNISNAVFLSALIILIIDPLQLFDPGFQLSYSAVLSLIYLSPRMMDLLKSYAFFQVRNVRYIAAFISVTLSAQIGTLPFTLLYFGKLSLIAIISNIAVIPLIAVLSSSAIFTLVISSVSLCIAKIYASANDMLTQLTYYVAHYLSSLRYSFLFIRDFSVFDSFIFYFLVISFFFIIKKFRGFRNKLILLFSFTAIMFVLLKLDDRTLLPDGKLSVMAIDVGQGDATLVRFPNNQTMLIDAGETNMYFDNGERVILPLLNRLGIDSVDYGIISHVDSDHYSGFISLLQKGIIKKIYKPPLDSTYSKDVKLEHFIRYLNVPINYFRKEIVNIGNTRIYVLNNEKWNRYNKLSRNDKSGLLKILYGKTSFMFVGDAGKKAEVLLIKAYGNMLSADILKLGHHGSKNSSSFNFLKAINPRFGLISAGVQNRFNHPSPLVLKELDSLKIHPLRTDQTGAVIIVSDGNQTELLDWKSGY